MSVPRMPVCCLAACGLAASACAADGIDLQFHGFASQGYLLTRNDALFTPQSQDKGTFEFNEAAVNVTATPVERLRVGIQIFAQDLGDSFNDQPQIDWAYGDYSFPATGALELGVTAGRLKMGHGLYNDFRDLDMTRTSVFLPMAVYNPRLRDYEIALNGVGVHGHVAGGAAGSLEFMACIGGQSADPQSGSLHDIFSDYGIALATAHIEGVDNANLTWNTPLDGLRLKYSLADVRGVHATGTARAGGLLPFVPGSAASFTTDNVWDNVLSVEYQHDQVTLAAEAEYWYIKGQFEGNVGIPISVTSYQVIHAAYISAAWRFTPRWEALGMWQWNEFDTVNIGEEQFHGFTVALRFDPFDHWLIKAEYTWIDGVGLLRRAEQPDGTLDRTWGYLALKTTFDF